MGKLMKKEIHKNLLQFYLLRYKKTEKYLCWKDIDKNFFKEPTEILSWE